MGQRDIRNHTALQTNRRTDLTHHHWLQFLFVYCALKKNESSPQSSFYTFTVQIRSLMSKPEPRKNYEETETSQMLNKRRNHHKVLKFFPRVKMNQNKSKNRFEFGASRKVESTTLTFAEERFRGNTSLRWTCVTDVRLRQISWTVLFFFLWRFLWRVKRCWTFYIRKRLQCEATRFLTLGQPGERRYDVTCNSKWIKSIP